VVAVAVCSLLSPLVALISDLSVPEGGSVSNPEQPRDSPRMRMLNAKGGGGASGWWNRRGSKIAATGGEAGGAGAGDGDPKLKDLEAQSSSDEEDEDEVPLHPSLPLARTHSLIEPI
jgi:hypothetical protein